MRCLPALEYAQLALLLTDYTLTGASFIVKHYLFRDCTLFHKCAVPEHPEPDYSGNEIVRGLMLANNIKKGNMNTRSILAVAAAATYMTTWASAEPKPIKVLTVTGDWKSQEWYQDEWMAKPGQPNHKLYRGRYMAAEVEKAAPGKFEFTSIP